MRISALFFFLMMFSGLLSQEVTYTRHPVTEISKWKEVTVGKSDDPFMVSIEPIIAPDVIPSKEKRILLEQKQKAQKIFPRQKVIKNRSSLEAPELINDFAGNNWLAGSPLDNHIAFSKDGQIVSTVNVHMVVMNESGFWLGSRPLDVLFESMTNVDRFFDPRVMYDPIADRWIMALMNGANCEDTELFFAFSKTNDATEAWNIYKIEACPLEDMTFADFPMISLIGNELFFTYNSVDENKTWQAGFVETFIWQIDKSSGYSGVDLNARLWTGVKYNGRSIRNLCPVKNATEELPSDAFFLSNRNFDILNDSIFILEISGSIDDPNAQLLIDVSSSNQPYGVPPNALQPVDTLQTNDARILDAFLLDEHIQFVGNTMDFSNGKAAVYYGIIENIFSTREINGIILSGGEDELGYPGLAFTGLSPGDRDAIIVASHASETRNPGYSACYVDGHGGFSDWLTVKEGQRPIDMFDNFTLERWGDYCGVQRIYDRPGMVYTSSSYGRYDRRNNTWVGLLSRPEMNVSTENINAKDEIQFTSYPNPTHQWIDLKFSLNHRSEIEVILMAVNGGLQRSLHEQKLSAGEHLLHLNLYSLPSGTYFVQLIKDNRVIAQKKVVKQ